jgi:hypothetical protein
MPSTRSLVSRFLAIALTSFSLITASCAGPEPEPVAAETESLVTAFPTGSLVIPMGTNFQNTGTLRAFGLVYSLLRNGVTVHWAILTGKAAGATDFTIAAPATVSNRETGAAVTIPAVYRGGSFIVSGADRAAALPIITAWLASDTVTVVHDVTGTFSADIARTLTAAPRIAVFADGNENIAFTNLNAAGITDSAGAVWGPTSVDLLTEAEITGPTAASTTDGALFRADGSPAFCHVTSMHWELPTGPGSTARISAVVGEVRSWLDSSRQVHAFMQCEAAHVFENNVNGRFLTTNGILLDGEPTVGLPLTVSFADSPFNQFDGMLQPDTGSVQSIEPSAGSAFHPFTRVLIDDAGDDVLWATARLGGDASNGQITYLAGHNYSVTTPITTNPQTNGVRLFLDSLFESDCAGTAAAPMVSIVASSPAASPTTTYTVSFAYTNTGMGFADSAVLRTTLPAGATFVSATGGGALMAGDVVWNLGNLAPGATATVTMTITVPGDGTYDHLATMRYLQALTPRTATSNTTTTVVSTAPPDTSIVTSEPDPTNDPTGDFVFASTIPGSVFECSIDGGAFMACTETFSTAALADGSHTLSVRASVPGGMTDATPATYTWVVDTTAPDTMIVTSEPNPTGDRSGDFVFASPDATATFECSVDGGAFAACPATFSTADLADGSHTIAVRAVDPAGNVDATPATYTWVVDTRNFVTVALPAEGSTTSDTTPAISGTGVPGAMVTVTVDGATVGTATVAADGTWSVTPTTALSEGPHTATATSTSSSGLTATDSNAFTIDSMTVVEVRQPAMGSTVGSARPEISGTSEPGNDVEITIDGAVVATVLTDGDGNWTYTPTTDLSDGMHSVSVEATDGAGNTATDATAFTVAATGPSVEIRSPVDGSTTSDTTPTISGRTDPGLMVRVTVDGVVVGTATADASGNWSIDVTTALASGMHTAAASVTDAAGRSAMDSSVFTVDATAPDVAIVAPADGARTADTTPAISGTADAGATVEVFVDGVLIGTTTAAADGTWSVTPTAPLGEGPHAARAVATDAAGNAATDGSGFIVDTSTAVAITAPADGATIGTPRPTIRGTAEPGAMVEVSVDGAVIGTVTAAADGSWSLRVPADVAAGMHDVSVEATDTVGNTATDTSTFLFDPALLDTDGDGLLDVDECPAMPCRDTDMDGNPDFDDPDDDGDGLPTTDEAPGGTPRDSDMDGRPDHLDPDDDNDGVPTAEESPGGMPRDTDMDGRPDHLDPDDDNDTIPTMEEAPGTMRPDTDGDGRPNYIDPDDDDDTIPTARERTDGMMHGNDVDGDGDPNWLDTDADGVMEGDEMEGTDDTDGDGVPDYLDPDGAPMPDAGMGGRDAGAGDASTMSSDGGNADAGPIGNPDAGGPTVGGFAGGACGCTVVGRPVAGRGQDRGALAALGLLGLALALARRKR